MPWWEVRSFHNAPQNRHFGVTKSDFRNLFYYWFIFELRIMQFDEEIADIKLKDIAIDILSYYNAYFNDEGEYWEGRNKEVSEKTDFDYIEYWFNYDKVHYRKKLNIKHKMIKFFSRHEIKKFNPNIVQKFMARIKISDDILLQCSRPGEARSSKSHVGSTCSETLFYYNKKVILYKICFSFFLKLN